MSDQTVAIAPIPLARSIGRIAVVTLVLLAAGAAAIGGGLVLWGAMGIALGVAGAVVVLLALYLAVLLLSVRMDVEVATLHVRWFGGDRRYALVRGPVTRVAVRGPRAILRPRFGALGWAFGRATLRGEEAVDLIRLAPTRSVILVPTDRGRLAIAPRVEDDLLAALAAAARVQQRLDEVAVRARAVTMPAQLQRQAAERRPETPAPHGLGEEPRVRVLTGIERAILEERLAIERAAALAAAEVERRAAEEAQRQAAAEAARREAELARLAAVEARAVESGALVVPGRTRQRMTWSRPAWMRTALPQGAAVPQITGTRLVVMSLLCLPAVAAAAVWLTAGAIGRPALEAGELRTAALALLVGGPVTALGGLVARTWFPRLLGLVLVSGFAALLLAGRALLA